MKLFFKLFSVLLVFANSFAWSQVNYNNSKLVILIEEPNKKIVEKLNPDELKSYQQEIEKYNLNVKKTVDQFWKIGANPEFVSLLQFNKMIEDKPLGTLLLFNSKYNFNYNDYSAYKTSNKLYSTRDLIVENYNKKQLPFRATMLEIKRADLTLTSAPIATAAMPSLMQEESDLIYAIKSLALQIDYRIKGTTEVQLMKLYIKNAPHLKELTLLINENDLDETAKVEIKNHYKLAYQLVNKSEIDKAILTADKTKAIVLSIPNADGSFAFKVHDASNMEILGQSGSIPPSEYYPELNNKVKVNHLEDFAHYCD